MVHADGGWVEFSFFRPGASRVHLAGDFNGWRSGELPMRPDGRGYWRASLRLPAGDYRFRYCADEEWFCDFASYGVEYGPFGPNGLVRVAPALPAG